MTGIISSIVPVVQLVNSAWNKKEIAWTNIPISSTKTISQPEYTNMQNKTQSPGALKRRELCLRAKLSEHG